MEFKQYGGVVKGAIEMSGAMFILVLIINFLLQAWKGGFLLISLTFFLPAFVLIAMALIGTVGLAHAFGDSISNAIIFDVTGITVSQKNKEERKILWKDIVKIERFLSRGGYPEITVTDVYGERINWHSSSRKELEYIRGEHPELEGIMPLVRF